jgi:GR25 family glycosyltransferase involved in LPS biosynthesis
MPSEIVPAVEGARLAPSDIRRAYARRRFRPRYPFALAPAEIGAFLSHRAAWRRIVDDGLDFAYVFEDDAQIDTARFGALFDFVVAERKRWDYVLLPAANRTPQGAAIARRGDLALVRPKEPPLRAIGQAVSRAAAERLLSVTEPFDRPIDTFLQMAWVTRQPVLAAWPSPVNDVSRETGGTTVQRKSLGLFERLRHEAMRPIYRSQVLVHYRRYLAASQR